MNDDSLDPKLRRNRPGDPPPAWHGRRGEWLVVLQFALFLVFVGAPCWNPWVPFAVFVASAPARWTALVVLGVIAVAFAALGIRSIRTYLTPLPYPVDHSQLVTDGVYALVRHPLYSSQLFAALGWTLFTLSLTHLALLAAGFLFFDYKAGKEERWLTERHPEYRDYARRVSKFIPLLY
jgi:protein-S-isoprenylcysteine O-methyltransferase Ste14